MAYEGLSTFTPVTVAVKHLWKRRSGSVGSLSESTLLLIKCFLNPCGPKPLVTLTLLGLSLGSPAEKHKTLIEKRHLDQALLGSFEFKLFFFFVIVSISVTLFSDLKFQFVSISISQRLFDQARPGV